MFAYFFILVHVLYKTKNTYKVKKFVKIIKNWAEKSETLSVSPYRK